MRQLIVVIMVVVSVVFGGIAEAKVKKFVGVGIYFKGNDVITVTGLMKGAPAYRAGIKEGDIIVKVDGKTFKNRKRYLKLINGKEGTPVVLTISRKGEINTVTLVREVIPQYTAYNIWVHKYMKCINYKTGDFIPAGTKISSARYYYYTNNSTNLDYILLILDNNKKYKISFAKRYHPNKKIRDYLNDMVGFKSFDELTLNLTEKEKDAIKQGKIIAGMRKKAVLISYGRPPEHKTPDLKSNQWIYWMNKFRQKIICFQNDLAVKCSDFKKLTDEI